MQIVVNKLLATYSLQGSGKLTILMLHGWADSAKTFDGLTKQLIKDSPDCTIVALDLPGFGGTQPPSETWGLDDYAQFVADFLAKIKRSSNVIIGHSNGGAIAVSGLAGGILKTEKLVLIASAGIRNPSFKKHAMMLLSKPAGVAIKATPQATQKRIRKRLYNAIGSDYLVAEHMQETFKRVVATDIRDDAAKISSPTCLIYGETDEATPPEYGKLLAGALQKAFYHEIPSAGHFVHQEQVYKVSNLIEDFIKS